MIPEGHITKKSNNGSCSGCAFENNNCDEKILDCFQNDVIFIKEWQTALEISKEFEITKMTVGRWVKLGLHHRTIRLEKRHQQRMFRSAPVLAQNITLLIFFIKPSSVDFRSHIQFFRLRSGHIN